MILSITWSMQSSIVESASSTGSSSFPKRPTFTAALLVVRGLAPDVASALVMMRAARAVVAPTRVDRAFLAAVEPRLRTPVRAVDLESPVG